MWYDSAIDHVMIDEEALRAKVVEVGARISADYRDVPGRVLLVGVLKGALTFIVDLSRVIDLPVEIDFMAISSYGAATQSSGVVRILKDLELPIEDRHVLVVEDIIDSGLTLTYILENLRNRNPASLKICSLLNKPSRRKVDVPVDYAGFDIPDEFVVGYGLDFGQIYRNLPFVGVLKPEMYAPAE
jgi:hypoxanthine phosphoribosyltransferase